MKLVATVIFLSEVITSPNIIAIYCRLDVHNVTAFFLFKWKCIGKGWIYSGGQRLLWHLRSTKLWERVACLCGKRGSRREWNCGKWKRQRKLGVLQWGEGVLPGRMNEVVVFVGGWREKHCVLYAYSNVILVLEGEEWTDWPENIKRWG